MKAQHKRYIGYLFMGFLAALVTTLLPLGKKSDLIVIRDYPEIIQSGVINAVTEYNSISYFMDGDTVAGFHYDLMREFAKSIGTNVHITPEMSYEKRMKGLEDGRFDVIAYDIPTTSEVKDSILLTQPILLSRQVLVQRTKTEEDSTLHVSSQLELANKTIYVEKGSPSILRLQHLSNEIGDTIYLEEINKYSAEQLIAMVAHGDIDYAICDERIAAAARDSFPQLDFNTPISFTQFYSWGIHKKSPQLLDSINAWLKVFTTTPAYKQLYQKYY